MQTKKLGGSVRRLFFVACALGLSCPAPATAAATGFQRVQVTSNIDDIRLYVGGGTVRFAPRPGLDVAFATALRKYVREADLVIDSADIRSATGAARDDEFVMTVLYRRHYGSTTYLLTAKSPHDYRTIEHDFRRELPRYLDICARQLAARLKEGP